MRKPKKQFPALLAGDLFATRNPMALGVAINTVQGFWSSDGRSEYSHAGIICDATGRTFESNHHIEYGHLLKYDGKKILIARNLRMTPAKAIKGWKTVKHLNGMIYPYWRLILHLIPPLARRLHLIEIPVCSELAAWFLHGCGLRHKNYMGTNVDTLVDEWKNYDDYDVIFEGVFRKEMIL